MKRIVVIGLLIITLPFALVLGVEIAVDPGHSGRVLFTGKQPMTIQWTTNVNPLNRTQIITTNSKQILAVSNSNEILCFDAKTGSMLWKGLMPEEVKTAPCITGTLGIATSIHGWVKAFDLHRGVPVFMFSVGSDELSVPVLGEKNIFLKGFLYEKKSAQVFAIDISKGKTTKISVPCAMNMQPPTLSTKAVFFAGTKNTNVVAYNQDLTELLWDVDLGANIVNISTRYGIVCATTTTGKVAIINRDSGELIWAKQVTPPIKWPASITQNGIILTPRDGGQLVKLDLSNGGKMWQNSTPSDCQPLVGREDVIVCVGKSVIFFSQETGQEIWRTELPSDAIGLPIPIEDQILAVTSSKKLVSLRTAGYEIALSSKTIDMGFATTANPELSANYTIRNISGSPHTINVESDADWLKVSGSGVEIAPFDFTDILLYTNLSQMRFGKHTARVTVTWPNGKVEFDVIATLLVDKQAIPPKPGILYIPDHNIQLSGRLNIGKNMTQVALFNKGELPISYIVKTGCNWLLPSNYIGTILPKSSQILYISIIVGNAQMGENKGFIDLHCKESEQSFSIPITFTRDYGLTHVVLGMTVDSTVANLNGTKVRARPAPYKTESGAIVIPLGVVKLALDAESDCFEYTDTEPLYILRRPDFSIHLWVGQARLFVETASERKEITLESKIEMKNGNPMIPLQGLAKALEGISRIDEGNKITLDVFIPELSIPQ
jgi:outer membrane protein assembly factor BamB